MRERQAVAYPALHAFDQAREPERLRGTAWAIVYTLHKRHGLSLLEITKLQPSEIERLVLPQEAVEFATYLEFPTPQECLTGRSAMPARVR